jgi:hypothetical protein
MSFAHLRRARRNEPSYATPARMETKCVVI